ncbi:MAG: response regulator [Saprospiraceae bacterium]
MESLNNKKSTLLSDVLLELALSIGGQQTSTYLIRKSIPLLLKRLECNTCGLFQINKEEVLQFQFIVPGIFPKTAFFQKLKIAFNSLCFPFTDVQSLFLDEQSCYFVPITKNEYLLLRRKLPFTPIQIKELKPLLLFLGNTYHNLNEKGKREKVEKELVRLSLVASQSTNGVIITDIHGRFEWINAGFTKISGWSLDEVRGKKPGEILQGEQTNPATIKKMRDAIKNGEGFDVEILNYNKSGTPYWIQIICNPLIDQNGAHTGFMAIESDVSVRKQYELDLIDARNEAIKAQKAEETFLAHMSHEIRTPLNAVIGMTSLLYETNLDEEQLDYIKTLDDSSNFLLGLISNVLDITKIQSGKIEVVKSTISLSKILDTLQLTYENRVKKKGLLVNIAKADNMPSHIISDERMLQQILNNLMSNAEKFTQTGEIGVRATQIIWKQKPCLKLEIHDTGGGIPPDKIDFLFKKFKQLHAPELTNTRGTGLGLAITKELVEVLKGEISVTSELGKGSVFTVKVPIELPEKSVKQKRENNQPLSENKAFSHLKILIVEDNLMNQKLIIQLMKMLSITFDLATDGKQAIDRANTTQYDVILMDIQLPDTNGYEVTRTIKNTQNPNKNSKIIALTASAMGNNVKIAYEVGMDGFLSKPFRPKDLMTKLDDVLG